MSRLQSSAVCPFFKGTQGNLFSFLLLRCVFMVKLKYQGKKSRMWSTLQKTIGAMGSSAGFQAHQRQSSLAELRHFRQQLGPSRGSVTCGDDSQCPSATLQLTCNSTRACFISQQRSRLSIFKTPSKREALNLSIHVDSHSLSISQILKGITQRSLAQVNGWITSQFLYEFANVPPVSWRLMVIFHPAYTMPPPSTVQRFWLTPAGIQYHAYLKT